MRWRTPARRSLLLFAAISASSAVLSAAERTIRFDPPNISLPGPGASQSFVLTALERNGVETDLTGACRVNSADQAVAVIEAGKVTGNSPGQTSLNVTCGETSTSAAVRVGDHRGEMNVNFARDLMSVLTRRGCNGSACHGSPAGQNGFKLSLYGSDPAADHQMIVHEHDGRRVDLEAPDESLILRKPSFQLAHGGGHLISPESDDYRMILRWLEQGAKFEKQGIRLERLELYPRERILAGAGAKQPLVVIGRLSDGTTLDMSERVRYAVDDEAVVSSVDHGAVSAQGRGLTTVTARAFGKVATAQLIVIDERAGPGYAGLTPDGFIDQHIFDKLRRVNLAPFPVSGDRTFVRRVYLDAIGMLPAPGETEAFVSDSRPGKRARLIDELLERDEYTDHWLVKFEDWVRNSQYYSQGRTNGSFKRWIREMIRHDRPWDEAVREMLTAVGDTTVRPAGNFWHPAIDFMLKTFDVGKATPTITRLFLGKRLECAECHNHPLENLTQDDFHGMAAFLARTKVKHGYGQYRRVWYDTRSGELEHPVTKKPVPPKFLGGEAPRIPGNVTRRQVLADWITRDQQMQFARATVNRVWAQYFGIGIVEPFDDFRSTNMPTHPRLLDRLAEYFIDSGFRFKALHRLILNSKSYQLSAHSADRPGGMEPLERPLFARYVPRKLTAEVLLDAIVQVTGVPEEFKNYPPGTSPKNLIASIGAPYFLTTFGFPRRDTMERRSGGPSMSQALHLMNSDTIRAKVEAQDNILGKLLAADKSGSGAVEALFQRAYARPPTADQLGRMKAYIATEQEAGRTRRRALENVLWAILNSKEFQLNR